MVATLLSGLALGGVEGVEGSGFAEARFSAGAHQFFSETLDVAVVICDGLLTAIDHHAKIASSTFDDFFEPAADASHTLYASPAIASSHEVVRIDTGTPLFMRAPGEATGSIALESAIDEMAQACGMDPLAFRLKNYADVEPITGKPFSSMTNARIPNASMTPMSKAELLIANAPTVQNSRITGISTARGTLSTCL